ncbi:MAG: choice-of-anchor D domain-containing protein [Deltaproteobacteria bacterium]|nr:choice-of-anchor D domain-containing protein [Deltaproteobacteria bacterium]
MTQRLPVLALVLPALVASACEDDVVVGLAGTLAVDPIVDFGDVPIGLTAVRTLTLKNSGEGNVTISAITPDAATFVTDGHTFSVGATSLIVGPRSERTIELSFLPFETNETPIESSITLKTDARTAAGSQETVAVTLRARGIIDALQIEPNPADFGAVLVGSSAFLDLTITNISAVPVSLSATRGRDGHPEVEVEGTGRFEVLAELDAEGTFGGPGDLDPAESLVVQVKYTPDSAPTANGDRGRWSLAHCPSGFCAHELRMAGRGTTTALDCVPGTVSFGSINPGRSARRTVECSNISSTIVRVTRLAIAGATEFAVAAPSAPVEIAPESTIPVELSFSPRATSAIGQSYAGSLEVEASSVDGLTLDPIVIALEGTAGGPTISVVPARLDFGSVAVRTTSRKRLIVSNTGYSDLEISAIDPDAAQTGAFGASSSRLLLPSGTSTVVGVSFEPDAEGDFTSELVLTSNDQSSPEVRVTLTGEGVLLDPCSYTFSPNPISFGAVTVGETLTVSGRFTNTGPNDCLINDVEIVAPDPAEPVDFQLVNGGETGIIVPSGDSRDFPVTFAPRRRGTELADLTFYVSDPTSSNPKFPLTGAGEATVEATCPGPQTIFAGQALPLTVDAITRGSNIAAYSWTIVSAPIGGIGTPDQWNPDPPETASVTFTPFIIGEYVIRVEVIDDLGVSATCELVVTVQGQGLGVTLSWDGTGDVDMHVSSSTTDPWFDGSFDCYYSDRTPLWDAAWAAGAGPNPELDFDNTTSFGPENTRIDAPVLGRVYTVGVHNYASAAGRVATIQIFCGGVSSPTATFTSRPLQGTDGGDCTDNDFWTVAQIQFTSIATCNITPIDTYTPSIDRCSAY